MGGRVLAAGVPKYFGCSSSCVRTFVYLEVVVGGKYEGIMADRRGRREGRHAVMMPTFVSTAENVAAGGLSKVGSFELEIATRDCSRTMEITQTLQ